MMQQPTLDPAAGQAAAAAMYQAGLVPGGAAAPQFDSLPSGKVPSGFDPSTCRSVYVGNIHTKVTESMLCDIFSNLGPLEGCKLVRKEKSSFGFINYFDARSAQAAMATLNGRQLFGQPIKVNWAFQGLQKEEVSAHVSIFVGDLGAEVTDAMLYAAFSIYGSCSDAKVMWDTTTGRSKGYGFVSFRSMADAEQAMAEMAGRYVGSRPVKCNWANKGASALLAQQQKKQRQQAKAAEQGGAKGEGQGPENGAEANGSGGSQAPDMTPQFTTVYVGNLSPEVTPMELHRQFYALGLGVIEDVKASREKGFGFVRYSTTEEAAAAIAAANGRVICGRPVKCSWGSKPTVPSGKPSQGLPPPPPAGQGDVFGAVPAEYGVGAAADLAAYQQRLRSYAPATGAQPNGIPGMGMSGAPAGPLGGMAQMGMGAALGAGGFPASGVGMNYGMPGGFAAGPAAVGGNLMAGGALGAGGVLGAPQPGGYDFGSAGFSGQYGFPQQPYY